MGKYGIELTDKQYNIVKDYIRKTRPDDPDLDPYFWLAWQGLCEVLGDDKLENGFTEEEAIRAGEITINKITSYLNNLDDE